MDMKGETTSSYNQRLTQEFQAKKSYIIVVVAMFIIFSTITLSMPFWRDSADEKAIGFTGTIPLLIFINIFAFIFWRFRPRSISTDNEGLWYTSIGKASGLVRWQDIHIMKDSSRYYELQDSQGKQLIRVYLELNNSEELVNRLRDTVKKNKAKIVTEYKSLERKFIIGRQTIKYFQLKCARFFFFIFFFGLMGIIIYSSSESSNDPVMSKIHAVASFLICISCVISFPFNLKKLFSLSYADVVMDEQGLWHQNNTEVKRRVYWEQIYKIRANNSAECLEVLDNKGNVLIRLKYELIDFLHLRDLLFEKVKHNYTDVIADCFSKGYLQHLLFSIFLSILLITPLTCYYIYGPDEAIILSVFSILILIASFYFYIPSEYRLFVRDNKLFYISLIGKRKIDFSSIKSVELKDIFDSEDRSTIVQITTSDNKEHALSQFAKVDTYALYLALKKAIEEYQSNNNDNQQQ